MIVKQTDSKVYTCPIAGTRRRGKNKAEDLALEEELLADVYECTKILTCNAYRFTC